MRYTDSLGISSNLNSGGTINNISPNIILIKSLFPILPWSWIWSWWWWWLLSFVDKSNTSTSGSNLFIILIILLFILLLFFSSSILTLNFLFTKSKFAEETPSRPCVDTSILLAQLAQFSPFSYSSILAILISPLY